MTKGNLSAPSVDVRLPDLAQDLVRGSKREGERALYLSFAPSLGVVANM